MTIAFLGACGEAAARAALLALDTYLQHAPVRPLEVSLGRIVPMGRSLRRYTALSALLSRGEQEARHCLSELDGTLTAAANREPPRRAATPHVTLVRPPRRASEGDLERGLAWANPLDLRSVRLRLDRIALYTWSSRRPGPLYDIVAERS